MSTAASGIPADASEIYRRYVGAVALHAHAAAREAGLGATDMYAVNLLLLDGPMTSGELSERTQLSNGATTRLIDRLERSGHLRRVPDPRDRRVIRVEPVVPDGDPGAHNAVLRAARTRLGAVLASYPPDQQAVLFDYFTRAAAAYRQAAADTASP